jgi:anti-anti-sigma factor
MPGGIIVDTTARSDGPVVRLSGEFNHANSHELTEAVMMAKGSATKTVFIDAAEVVFFDSSWLKAFLLAQRELAREAKRFRIIAASPTIARLIEITGRRTSGESMNVDVQGTARPDPLARGHGRRARSGGVRSLV